MSKMSGPQHVADALSEVVALRGLARVDGNAQLELIWKTAAGEAVASQTMVVGIRRHVLRIAVCNAPLLAELRGFHRASILQSLQEQHEELAIRDLKFFLKGELTPARR